MVSQTQSPSEQLSPAQTVAHAEALLQKLSTTIDGIIGTIDAYSAPLSPVAYSALLPRAAAQAASAKRTYVALQRAAQRARDAVLPAARTAASCNLRLQNVRFEAELLRLQHADCATVATPHLDRMPTLSGAALDVELNRRRALSARVNALRKKRDERAAQVRRMEDALKALPDRVSRAARDVPALRNFVHSRCGEGATDPAVAAHDDWMKLCAPLYALVYQACACKGAGEAQIDVRVVRASGGERPKLHGLDEWAVELTVGGAELRFSFMPKLGIVIVTSDAIDVADLTMGEDRGVQSPNPANKYLNGGKFTFDKSVGRAFRWANSLCGLLFMAAPGTRETHMRFVEVLGRVRRRVERLLVVKAMVRSTGKRRRGKVTVGRFEKVSGKEGVAVLYRIVVKGGEEMVGAFRVGLGEKDTPVFRMESGPGSKTEIDKNVNDVEGGLREKLDKLVELADAAAVEEEPKERSRDTRRKIHDRERVADYSDV